MIARAKDLRTSEHEKLRDGNGKLTMHHFLEEADSGGVGRLFALTTIPPGSSIGTHTHEGNFEVYYVTEGKVEVHDNGKPDVLEAGDCMICKDGDNHCIENKSDRDAKVVMLVIYTKR